MTLLVDPPELAQYAKRGDPHIDQWPGQPVNRLAIKFALYRLAARTSGISGRALIIVDSF